ncbi:hypothetical protein LOK49_LG09G01368 [Camellia lanceoleosa]|uniref:Uncharacterized protein n=1 Tax=Camellia lanceoleosa TaxID=1840588 RepID=A0ACC0GL09_9ERIC|nr:hypothetical protein LOK49_LG09G01368 [Camellia lanceoleosa]
MSSCSRVQLTQGGDDEGHLGLCYTNKIQGAVVLGRSSCQLGGCKRNGSTPRLRSIPQSSTQLATRRQKKLPLKKTKIATRSIKKPVVDPSKLMYCSNIARVIKMVLEFNFGACHIKQLQKTPFWLMGKSIQTVQNKTDFVDDMGWVRDASARRVDVCISDRDTMVNDIVVPHGVDKVDCTVVLDDNCGVSNLG